MEYVINFNRIDKSLIQDVEKIVHDMKDYYSKKSIYSERIVLLHAWKPAVYDTCCVFAEVNKMDFTVFFACNNKAGFAPMISTRICFYEFYLSYQAEMCENVMRGWLEEEYEKREFDNIWNALLNLFPDYTAPVVKYEKYIPYNLDEIVGAEEYLNQGILFQLSETNNSNHNSIFRYDEWKVSNHGKQDEKRHQIAIRFKNEIFQTEEEYEDHILNYFKDKLLKKILLSIPHKTYYLDTPLSDVKSRIMGASYECREINIYESKTDASYILLNKNSVYYGDPSEGGTMGGTVFSKLLEVPANEYGWTSEKLIDKYEKYFPEKGWRNLGFQTKEEYEKLALNLFNDIALKEDLLSNSHKTYYLDTPLSEVLSDAKSYQKGAYYECRGIHVYKSKKDEYYVLLKKDSIYFGYPSEGGTMGGTVFNEIMKVAAEEYNWTCEQLIDKYEKYFSRRKSLNVE